MPGPASSPVSAAPWAGMAGPVHYDSAIVSGAVSGAWAPFLVSKVFLLDCFPWTRPKSIPRDGSGNSFRGKFNVDGLGVVDCLNRAGGGTEQPTTERASFGSRRARSAAVNMCEGGKDAGRVSLPRHVSGSPVCSSARGQKRDQSQVQPRGSVQVNAAPDFLPVWSC